LTTNYVLIDFENVQVKSLTLLKDEHFRVCIFLGPKNLRLPRELVLGVQSLGDRAEYIVLDSGGHNALDFHIAYYLGVLAERDPTAFFHIISKDTGFDPLLLHLKGKQIRSERSTSIEKMPCFAALAATGTGPCPNVPRGRSVDELLEVVVRDLIKRKVAKPTTGKKLWSTIQATCGKDLPSAEIDAVYEALIERGYLTVEGTKVVYDLPTS
jgi:PIN domain